MADFSEITPAPLPPGTLTAVLARPDGERYFVLFVPDEAVQAISTICRWAHDDELSLTAAEAARMAKSIRMQVQAAKQDKTRF